MRLSSAAITRQYSPRLRHLDAAERLARHRPALVAEHRGDVVDAVGVRHEAVPADLLGDLLDRAVQVADVGDRLAHHLAVGLDDEAQHAVRARVLRTHVEGHLLGLEPGSPSSSTSTSSRQLSLTVRRRPHSVDRSARELRVMLGPLSSRFVMSSRLSRMVEMPWYSSGSTKSLRSG